MTGDLMGHLQCFPIHLNRLRMAGLAPANRDMLENVYYKSEASQLRHINTPFYCHCRLREG